MTRAWPYQRGFASVGLFRPKCAANVGGVLRLAQNYGVALVAIAGDRSIGREGVSHGTNTLKSERSVPLVRGADLHDMIPFGAIPIAVDLVDDAIPLPSYRHPNNAFYVFGPEDGTLGKNVLAWCEHRIMVPTRECMNLHVTVAVVLYDRLSKAMLSARAERVEAA